MLAFDRLDKYYFADIHLDFVAKECEQVPRTVFSWNYRKFNMHSIQDRRLTHANLLLAAFMGAAANAEN